MTGKLLMVALHPLASVSSTLVPLLSVTRTLVGDLKAFGFPTDAGRDVFVGEEFSFRDSRLVVTLPPRESRFILFEQDKKGISR